VTVYINISYITLEHISMSYRPTYKHI
jgi:hypothetical protein